MKTERILILAGTLALALQGCTSLSKRAQEHMEAGEYDKAASTYERILKSDPKDAEAQAGLKRARSGIIDSRLIAARKARQGGNPNQALDILLDVLAKEKEWSFTPGSKVAFTQEEEIGFAVRTASTNSRSMLSSDHALKARNLATRYEPLYQGKHRGHYDSLLGEITKKGKARCRSFLKSDHKGKPYFADFVIRYCGHWREPAPALGSISASKTGDLIRGLV